MRQRFEKELEKGGPIKMICVVERTAIATRLAVRTVFNIKSMLPPESGSTLTRSIGWLFVEWFMGFIYERSIQSIGEGQGSLFISRW